MRALKLFTIAFTLLLAGTAAYSQELVEPETGFDYSVFMSRNGRGRAQQGMVVKGKYLFSLEDGGHVNIYNFRTADPNPIGEFTLASAQKDNHANNAEFGIETKKGASFPLMYVTNGKPGSAIEWTCFVESVTLKNGRWSTEIAQKIILDGCNGWKEAGYTEIFGAPSWLVDRQEKALWVFSAIQRTTPQVTKRNEDNLYVATKFRIPRLSEGEEVHLGVGDILDQVTFTYDIGFTQAGCVEKGMIYYCFGVGKDDPLRPAAIRVYDTHTGKIAARYNVHKEILQEPEDIVLKGKWIYLNANTNWKGDEKPDIYRISRPTRKK